MKKGYIRSIANVFAKSPFKAIHVHAEKVGEATYTMKDIFNAYFKVEYSKVDRLNKTLGKIEHEADELKREIRAELTHTIMLPVGRSDLLAYLTAQDRIADAVEEAARLLTLKRIRVPEKIQKGIILLLEQTEKLVNVYEKVVDDTTDIIEFSLSKSASKELLVRVHEVDEEEHQADLIEIELLKNIYTMEGKLKDLDIAFLLDLVRKLGAVPDRIENAGDRLRTMIAGL